MSKAFKRRVGKTEKRQNERKTADLVCTCVCLTVFVPRYVCVCELSSCVARLAGGVCVK